MKKILLAFQFLTILPIKANIADTEADIAKSSSGFLVVGFTQGLLLVITDYALGIVFHHDLVIGIVLLVLVLSNGGFHLDGLADTFDAIAAKAESSQEADREKRLLIMKDSATGPIGVIAIVFALFIKYLSLRNLSFSAPFIYYSSILLMPVLSKWAMVVSMFYGKPAKKDGLGSLFINKIGFKELGVSTLILFLLLVLLEVLSKQYALNNHYIFYAISLIGLYILVRLFIRFFNKKFGGLTGDTLGAISEATEIIFLLMVISWSRLST